MEQLCFIACLGEKGTLENNLWVERGQLRTRLVRANCGQLFVKQSRLQCIFAVFACSNPNSRLQVGNEDLAIADLPSLGSLHDGVDHRLQVAV